MIQRIKFNDHQLIQKYSKIISNLQMKKSKRTLQMEILKKMKYWIAMMIFYRKLILSK